MFDKQFEELFKDKPEALEFLMLYSGHCALVDDTVDEESSVDRTRKLTLVVGKVFNCNYWRKYGNYLFLLDRLIHNTYFDSVEWEKSEEEWKRQHAKVYSHACIEMILAVILIEFGDDKLKEVSLSLRETAYLLHKNDKI